MIRYINYVARAGFHSPCSCQTVGSRTDADQLAHLQVLGVAQHFDHQVGSRTVVATFLTTKFGMPQLSQ